MATVDELVHAFGSAWSGGALPSDVVELGPRLAELCAAARAGCPGLAIDEHALVAAIAARAVEDPARYLERCHAADLALVLAASGGSAPAIEQLERAHGATIAFVCHRFVGPGHTVDDLRQILRVKLFVPPPGERATIAEYDGQGSLGTWLRVIAVRLFIDLTRRKDRAREAALGDQTPDLIDNADLGLDAIKREYRAAVAAALVAAADRLEPGDRHLLRQHLVAGLSIDQLGAALGIHRATAARRIGRAREQLAAITRALLAERLALDESELGEVYGLVVSKLDLSMRRVLASERGEPT